MTKYKNKSRGMCQTLIIMILVYMIIGTIILITLAKESFEMIIVGILFYVVSIALALMLYFIRFQFYFTKYNNDNIVQSLFWSKKIIQFKEIKTLLLINDNICLLKKEYTSNELEEILKTNKRKNKVKFMKNNICININLRDYNLVNRITSIENMKCYIIDTPNGKVLEMLSDIEFIRL